MLPSWSEVALVRCLQAVMRQFQMQDEQLEMKQEMMEDVMDDMDADVSRCFAPAPWAWATTTRNDARAQANLISQRPTAPTAMLALLSDSRGACADTVVQQD